MQSVFNQGPLRAPTQCLLLPSLFFATPVHGKCRSGFPSASRCSCAPWGWPGCQALTGRIDVLVNNVGGTIWVQPFAAYGEAQITAEINRSLFPTLWCCHAVLPYMIKQGGGSIVNVSSTATRGIHRVPYSAAKGGVNALTTCLAFEYAQQGIRVNAVAPGGTDVGPRRIPRNTEAMDEQHRGWYQAIVDQTIDSTFVKRYGTPDEQAAAILFLASDEASYITGATLPVAGGDAG